MATLRFLESVDMYILPSTWYGSATVHTSTTLTIKSGSNIGTYSGTGFTYSGNSVTGGTLKGLTQTGPDIINFTITGLNISAKTVYDLVSANNTFGLETLALAGNDSITGSQYSDKLLGFAGNDTLHGGAGNDAINGGLGNDSLTGGLGTDFFVFNTALNATTNKDTITDFNVVDDTIKLENAIMTKLGANGTLTTSQFKKGAGFTSGKDADDHIIYNTTTGALYYDSNGNGAGGSVQIALIGASSTHAALTYADFVVI